MVLRILTLILISGLYIGLAQSSLDYQFRYADSLYNSKNYYDAVTEFKRFICFSDDYILKAKAFEKIGDSYIEGGFNDKAVTNYHSAELELNEHKSLSREEKLRIGIKIARTYIRANNTDVALRELDYLEDFAKLNLEKEDLLYFRGWAYMVSGQWKHASGTFAKLPNYKYLETFCDSISNLQYSESFAKILSIIPGLGQYYTGNYFSGTLSLAYTVLLGWGTTAAIMTERYVEAVLIGELLFARFYLGNIENAGLMVQDKNNEINKSALIYLSNEFKGIKP